MRAEETTLERLAYIKNLHEIAIDISRKPSPFGSTAILAFHDAAEMFLQLTLEYFDGRNEEGFMAYWWEIECESDIEISQKESMRDLHNARNALKHEFRRPSEADLETYRATVNRFFEENVPKVFDINYSNIDLVYLVEFDQTREHLQSAKDELGEGQTRDAAITLQQAFDDLIKEYEDRAFDQLGYIPHPRLSYSDKLNDYEGSSNQLAEDASNIFSKLFQALKIIAMEIDYRDYKRFQHVTADARRAGSTNDDFDVADIEFGIRFVAESALVLQDVPMSLEEEYQHPRTKSAMDW